MNIALKKKENRTFLAYNSNEVLVGTFGPPSGKVAVSQTALVATATDFVHRHHARSFAEESIVEGQTPTGVAQLVTHDSSTGRVEPLVLTHCAPVSVEVHLHTPFHRCITAYKSHGVWVICGQIVNDRGR